MTLLVVEGWLLCCCAYETIKVEEGRIVEIKTKLNSSVRKMLLERSFHSKRRIIKLSSTHSPEN